MFYCITNNAELIRSFRSHKELSKLIKLLSESLKVRLVSLITIILTNNSNCSHPFPYWSLLIWDHYPALINLSLSTLMSSQEFPSLLARISEEEYSCFLCCITPHYLLGRNSIQTWHQEKCFPKTKDEIIVFHSAGFTFILNHKHILSSAWQEPESLKINMYLQKENY